MKPVFALALLMLPALNPVPALAQDAPAHLSPAHPAIVPYRYHVDLSGTLREGDDPEQTVAAVFAVDPSQPAGSRVSLVSREGSEDKAAQEMIDGFVDAVEDEDNTPERMAESFYCTLSADVPLTPLSETADATVYSAEPAALMLAMQGGEDAELSSSERKMMRRMAKRMEAEVRRDAPTASDRDGALRSMSVRLLEPVTVMVIAKIRQMDFSQTCTPAPDGHMRSDTFTMATDAGAFGKSMQSTMTVRLRDLERLPG